MEHSHKLETSVGCAARAGCAASPVALRRTLRVMMQTVTAATCWK
jgi:hypothetical protein